MMDWTDRHCRFFHRLLTRKARLYTEMVTTGALLHGDRERLIGYSHEEHPVALQIGGAEPAELAEAARIGADHGYDEINLNCGCPSDRVQSGRFGACLMAEPDRVGACVAAMKAAVSVPVTVKCRIGIDDQDSEEALERFVSVIEAAGADAVIVHARKAWLQGLSPKENRDIPPLDYGRVRRLKSAHPRLPVIINGGIGSLEEATAHLGDECGVRLDGVMLGRAAYRNPGILLEVDPRFFGTVAPVLDARSAVEAYRPYVAARLAEGVRLPALVHPLIGLFQGVPGARAWRRILTVEAVRANAGLEVIDAALATLPSTAAALETPEDPVKTAATAIPA